MTQDSAATGNSETGKQEGTAAYSFTFEEKPEGLENISDGDTVTVKYTGTISEVDPFEGEIISIEKTK